MRRGQPLRARGTRHSEECRSRLYDAMPETGNEKFKRADLDDANRTRIQPKKILKKCEEITADAPAVDAAMEHLDDNDW